MDAPTPMPVDKLWYTRCPVPTASGIAIQNGWIDGEFARDGIEVLSLRSSSDPGVRTSHFDHRQVNSFRQGGNAPPIWARSDGQDTVVVGLTWLPQYQSILSLPQSGIRSLEDLAGKRLAVPRRLHEKIDFWRASALQGYLQALASVGLAADAVDFVDLPIDEPYIGSLSATRSGALFDARQVAGASRTEAFALIRGEVDVIYLYGANGPALEAFLGATVVCDLNRHSDQDVAINNGTPNVLTVSGELVRRRPDIVARYLCQVLHAAKWAKAHWSEAQRIIAAETGVAEEWIPYAFDARLHENLELTLNPDLVRALEVRKNFLFEHGFIPKDFSILDWIDPRPLATAYQLLKTGLD